MEAGYGNVNEDGQPPKKIQMAPMIYRNFDWCYDEEQYTIPGDGPDYHRLKLLCTISTEWPKGQMDTCSGDSGGPFFKISSDANLYQFAVTSFGTSDCGSWGVVSWSVRVIYFKNDVDKLMAGKRAHWYPISGNQVAIPGRI